MTQDTFKSLFLEQKQHQAVESELSKQRSQLRDRAVFLERLQMCIGEAPAQERLAAQQKDLKAAEAKLAADRAEFEKMKKEFAEKQATLITREEFTERKDKAVKEALKEDKTHRELIETRAKEIKETAEALRRSERDLQERVANIIKREEDLASREQDVGKTLDEFRGQQARFLEVKEQERERLYKDSADVCNQYNACGGCTRNPKCGWCAASADGNEGRCLSHNVNAVSDGLTSGQCSIKNWYSKVSDRMSALNLNVFGGDYADKEQRASALFNVIISAKYPDFVAFQEVSEWFMSLLKDQAWFKNYYHMTDYPVMPGAPNAAPPGGLLILSRFPINSTTYHEAYTPTMTAVDMRPRLLLADVHLNGKTITVGTTTLDWRDGVSRSKALSFIHGITRKIDNFLFMGDFNFDDGAQPETASIPTSWIDLWPRVHNVTAGSASTKITRGPNRYGYTWDPRSNWYARYSDVNSRPSRIDRVFLRSTVMLPREIHLVGCPGPDYLCQDPPPNPAVEKIPFQKRLNQVQGNVVYPSSHYGLLTSFSIFLPYC